MDEQTPRCLDCGYVLLGLQEGRCPECGRPFDLSDPLSYSRKPLFVRWRFWLPAFVLATVSGAVLYLIILMLAGWGFAVTIVAPFCVGAVIGYGCRTGPFFRVLLSLMAMLVIVFTLFSMSFVGLFCGSVLAAVALLPILVGTFCGYLLRVRMKDSRFSQRWYLPPLALMCMAVLWGGVERLTLRPLAIESVVTSIEIPAPAGRVWNALMFYEEVRTPPPWLLRHGLPRPLFTRGGTARVGDVKTCVYSKGHLTKRVTQREPERLLAFDVIEQDRIETHSVRLTGGSFAFSPTNPSHTRVELTTSYEPRLAPRWVWRPFETLAVHTLHRHVLDGMSREATQESPAKRSQQP